MALGDGGHHKPRVAFAEIWQSPDGLINSFLFSTLDDPLRPQDGTGQWYTQFVEPDGFNTNWPLEVGHEGEEYNANQEINRIFGYPPNFKTSGPYPGTVQIYP